MQGRVNTLTPAFIMLVSLDYLSAYWVDGWLLYWEFEEINSVVTESCELIDTCIHYYGITGLTQSRPN